EIDESISKLVERIREWNNIYFPEIDIIQNNESYINLIAENENREETLKNLPESIQIDVSESNGADIENEDIEIINNFAKSIQSLQKSRIAIENYIDQKMEKIAPNLRGLIGSSLGAKLIAHIGSLKRLAMCSSSTVQIIGAEKALFRHLKTGERPPKHGLIFQHPEVRTAPWWIRGKIARTLSLKISLAIRKDVFSGDFDPTISESFLEKVKEIKKENPFPTKTKKRIEEERTGKRSSKTSKKQLKKHKKKYKKKRKKKKKK
ncbi:MAG: NOP58 family protein, partial [Methanobrevibacter sp.]|nr:NOP58 family protein [Methanobrevibacter sp.]